MRYTEGWRRVLAADSSQDGLYPEHVCATYSGTENNDTKPEIQQSYAVLADAASAGLEAGMQGS